MYVYNLCADVFRDSTTETSQDISTWYACPYQRLIRNFSGELYASAHIILPQPCIIRLSPNDVKIHSTNKEATLLGSTEVLEI